VNYTRLHYQPISLNVIINKLSFYNVAGFSNIVGCIDCSHDCIKEAEDAFVNGKGVHTINIQAVCYADMKLINVVAKWPGSAHDAFIWHNSQCVLRAITENI